MKKLSLLFVFISAAANAQFYPGLTAGYQAVSFKSKDSNSSQGTGSGFRVGGFIDNLFADSKFGTRLEGAYSFIYGEDNLYNTSMRLHYVSIPASLFYMPHPQFQLFLGPQVNVLLNKQSANGVIASASDRFERVDFGVFASMEFQFADQWSLAFRYYHGLNYNTKSTTASPGTAGSSAEYMNRISLVQLCVNYFFVTSGKKNSSKP